ncbi:uncharacterized protein LOC120944314 [Rana temporaria]|uniref:uncharacterized protein LOC120944314 n=1 Tax=Rana temporaria TaxID=8407 RepID=UPI001AACB073|nr:uncharacterized protein LOC120944314 [Rana temporaria]
MSSKGVLGKPGYDIGEEGFPDQEEEEKFMDRGHPILVRTLPSEKNLSLKLMRYFGSNSKSGGGECEVTRVDGQTYCAVFQNQDDQRRVLGRGNHVIEVTVPVTVHDIGRGDLARIRQLSGDEERLKALQRLAVSAENSASRLPDQLSQVKTFLEKADHKPADHKPADHKPSDHKPADHKPSDYKPSDHKPARPPRPVTISTSNMKTEIEVDTRHMDILKKLKHREISDIEKKYNVMIEENKKNVSSLVTFRSLNAPPDLSPHASHSFITLLQKTFFNIERKEISVKPEFTEERVSLVQKQLMMAGIDIVMEYSKGTLLLIGDPVHVAFAEEKLNGM